MRWIVSATFRACWFAGVERSATSWPSKLRLSEALKVAKRTSACFGAARAAGTSRSAASATSRAFTWSSSVAVGGDLYTSRRAGVDDVGLERGHVAADAARRQQPLEPAEQRVGCERERGDDHRRADDALEPVARLVEED